MKKSVYIVALFISVFAFNACKDKVVVPPPPVNEFTTNLSDKDTLDMLKICDDCMELLKAGEIDAVVSNLYDYDDSLKTVTPISEDAARRFRRQIMIFPVHDYRRVSYKFFSEGLNDVKYEVIFAEQDKPEVNGEFKTYFMFNPVKVDGKWHLCVKQSDQRING